MAVVPLVIRTGDTRSITLTILDGDEPVDLTGRTFLAQLRVAAGDAAVLDSFAVEVDALEGVVLLTLTATQTAALTPGTVVWDVQETNGAVVTTLAGGTASIVRDVSR